MSGTHVILHAALYTETFITKLAREWKLSCMYSFVNLQAELHLYQIVDCTLEDYPVRDRITCGNIHRFQK